MSRYDVPRPQKSAYTSRHQKLVGRGTFTYFDSGAYNMAVAAWEEGRDAHNASQQSGGSDRGGARFSTGGRSHVTVNSTDNPRVPGGHYVSVGDDDANDHSTAVYNPDGTLADVKANKGWKTRRRQ
jgi:hypothetical protein